MPRTEKEKIRDKMRARILRDEKKLANVVYKNTTADAHIETFADDRDIWEQQPGESDKDFDLFEQYYLFVAPEERNYKTVAKKTGRGYPAIASKGGKKRWVERGKAFRDWSHGIVRERIQYKLEQGVDRLFGRIDVVSKMIDTALGIGVDVDQIDSHLHRTYALEKLMKLDQMTKDSLIQIVDGKFKFNGAELEAKDGGVTIKFIKSGVDDAK